MRAINLILLLLIASSALTDAQVPAPPQTARQALLEMVLAKSPGAFERHLPEAARNALRHGGDTFQMPVLRELTAFRNGFLNPGQQLETFDSGPLLLTVDEKEANRHVEIGVERDDLMGDLDEIELSYHAYVDGKPELMPVKPSVVLSMGQENDVWKLNEVTVAMHVPLSDPDYLRDVQKSQNPALESVAVASLRTIEAAEISYSASFP